MWLPVAIFLGVCIICCLVRIFLGPDASNRVVAFDTTNTLVIASMVILGIAFNQVVFIDVAIVYALISFITALFIAKYIEGAKF